MGKKRRRKNHKKRIFLRVIVLIICIPLFCFSAYKVGSQLIVDHRENQAFNELLKQVDQARRTGASAPSDGADTSQDVAPEAVPLEPGETPVPPILSDYAALHAQNSDLFGWIEIEDTVINYPVMYTPEDPEYYLHRAFDRTYSFSGVPFMDANCALGCGNYILYGHNMKNGTMFAGITKYKDSEYWQEHPSIRFDTLYESNTYDIFAAFYSQAYPKEAVDVFRYYQFSDLTDAERFAEYAEQVKAAALYDTGIEVEYGDELITLSTCEYHADNGRFVIVAKKRIG